MKKLKIVCKKCKGDKFIDEDSSQALSMDAYSVRCPRCETEWVTTIGSRFDCLACGASIHAQPQLKIVK